MSIETPAQEIARLRAENAALIKAAEDKANQDRDGLPILTSYDRSLLATADDIVETVKVPGLSKVTKAEVATLFKVFGLEPQAQYRPATKSKGRGFQLYLLAEVNDFIAHISAFNRG